MFTWTDINLIKTKKKTLRCKNNFMTSTQIKSESEYSIDILKY